MNSLSDALAYAFAYLGGCPRESDDDADDDCKALESMMAMLNTATPAEIEALKKAALRGAADAEAGTNPNHTLASAYREIIDHFEEAQ